MWAYSDNERERIFARVMSAARRRERLSEGDPRFFFHRPSGLWLDRVTRDLLDWKRASQVSGLVHLRRSQCPFYARDNDDFGVWGAAFRPFAPPIIIGRMPGDDGTPDLTANLWRPNLECRLLHPLRVGLLRQRGELSRMSEEIDAIWRAAAGLGGRVALDYIAEAWVDPMGIAGAPLIIANAAGAARLLRLATGAMMARGRGSALASFVSGDLSHVAPYQKAQAPLLVAHAGGDDRHGEPRIDAIRRIIASGQPRLIVAVDDDAPDLDAACWRSTMVRCDHVGPKAETRRAGRIAAWEADAAELARKSLDFEPFDGPDATERYASLLMACILQCWALRAK